MKKFMSLLLGAMLILSLIPMSVGATTESWNSFVYYQDGPEFSVEATEFVGAGAYKFIAAAYDANGKLVDMTSSDAAVNAGTLSAAASFEAPGEEADVSIASVKTMLWDSFSGATPIAKAGEFAVTPQTVSEDGVYNNLTNGFYEAIPVKIGGRATFGAWDEETQSFTAGLSDGRNGDAEQKSYDNNLATGVGYSSNYTTNDDGEFSHYLKRMDYVTLAEASKVDRIVTVSYDNPQSFPTPRQFGTEYYLKSGNSVYESSGDAAEMTALWNNMAVKADNEDFYYIGTNDSTARVITDADAKLVYDVNSSNKYTHLIAKKNGSDIGGGGTTYELQAYKKIQNKIVIDAFTASVEYNGLTYSQNGPEFTVKAGEVVTNTDLVFTATAYNASGDVVAVVKEDIKNTGTAFDVEATVNFEAEGEADASITSVKTVITDTFGIAVVEDSTFTVTANTCTDGTNSYPMTNGFYKPITTYQDDNRVRLIHDDGYTSWSNGGCIYDNNLTTQEGFASGALVTGHIQVMLSEPTKIDRVVVYNYTGGQNCKGTEYYLTNLATPDSKTSKEEREAYFYKYVPETQETGIYYLGVQSKNPATVDADGSRLVFDVPVTAGAFKKMIAKYTAGLNGGYIEEYQAYQKVTATHVVSAFETKASYEELIFTQNGPEFGINAKGLESNADELMLVATAYNAEGAKLDEKAKVFATGAATASVNFEENGTEADVNIAKVTVVVKDATGTNDVTLAQDFAITPQSVDENGVYNNLTNGFYQKISIANASNTEYERFLFDYNATAETHTYGGGWQDDNIYDSNPITCSGTTGSLNKAGRRVQYVVALDNMTEVDRVVTYTTSTMKFYLSKSFNKNDIAYTGRFLKDATTDQDLCYLGNRNAGGITTTVNGVYRMVFDADGRDYQYIVADLLNDEGDIYALYDMQAYKKVKASYSYGWAYASVTAGATSHLTRPDEPDNVRTDTEGRLTDGKIDTAYGQGVVDKCSYIFIDLGEAKQLDKVSFYAKDSRTRGIKFWLADTKPMVNADKSTWAYLGEMTVAGTDDVTAYHEFILNENQAGKWQYVVADLTGQGVGGYVQEIGAFAKVPGVPAYEAVTANALSYHARVSEPDSARLNANPVLTDGDTATCDGQGVKGACASVFIDLQTETQIDKVSFLVYDGSLRTKGAKFYLTNTRPVHNADKSDRVYVGEVTKAVDSPDADGAYYEFELTPEQAGEYRYVMVDLTEAGGYVYEISAFKTVYVAETVTGGK